MIIAFGGFFALSQKKSPSVSSAQPTSHIDGKGSTGVTLIEYGDYQCSSCKQYAKPLKEAVSQLSSQIFFQFRHLPLSSIHKNALAGARAAEAAGLQGKFWEMHELLYESQDPAAQTGWVASSDPLNDFFVKFAQNFNLNIDKFKQDYASSAVNDSIQADLSAFGKTGEQQATPSFFLDGTYIQNSQFSEITPSGIVPSTAKIVQVIKAEIAKKASAPQAQ